MRIAASRARIAATTRMGLMMIVLVGCRQAPPPPRVPVPTQDQRSSLRQHEEMRPLPPPAYDHAALAPPFADEPLVTQRPPEQRAFVEAYRKVASPTIILSVVGQEGAALAPIDYEAVETIMSDWFACAGQVRLLAPSLASRRLTEAEDRSALAQLGADVAIYVRAAATPRGADGSDLRLVAQAISARGGESIGRAVVDVPPPLDKAQINEYTRFLARKLMDDMTQTWSAPAPPARDTSETRDTPAARDPETTRVAPATSPAGE